MTAVLGVQDARPRCADRFLAASGRACHFCGAAAQLVPLRVLDEKWSRRFGGVPAVALDHGWFRSAAGHVVAADHLGTARSFPSQVRAACDFCTHGWIEDVRWRAEPPLLALANQREGASRVAADPSALVRWTQLTAMLAELLDGMPTASSPSQRDAVRRGAAPEPEISCWFFTTRQRLPARIHLSQVRVAAGPDGGLIQIVSIDVAHFAGLVVLPSDGRSREVVRHAALAARLGAAVSGRRWPQPLPTIDLSRTPHPHRAAVQLLCTASTRHTD